MGELKNYKNCSRLDGQTVYQLHSEKSLPGGFYPLRYACWPLEIFLATETFVGACLPVGRQTAAEWILRSTIHKQFIQCLPLYTIKTKPVH